MSIGQDGAVSYTDENPKSPTFEQQVTAGYLSLAQFPNQDGLERLGGSLWSQTTNSGAPIVGTPNTGGFGQTMAGELEMSNVDLATEMTSMITAERGYQANSKVITTANEMLQTVVTMVRSNRTRGHVPRGAAGLGAVAARRAPPQATTTERRPHDHPAQARTHRRALPTESRPDRHRSNRPPTPS